MPTQYTGLNRDPKFPNFRSSWVTLSKVSRTHAETQRRKMWVRTLCRHELDRTRQDNPEIKSIWQDGCFPPSTVTVHSGRRKNRQRCLALLERPLLQRPREPGIGLLIVFIPTIFKAALLLKICSNCHELTLRVLQKKKKWLVFVWGQLAAMFDVFVCYISYMSLWSHHFLPTARSLLVCETREGRSGTQTKATEMATLLPATPLLV